MRRAILFASVAYLLGGVTPAAAQESIATLDVYAPTRLDTVYVEARWTIDLAPDAADFAVPGIPDVEHVRSVHRRGDRDGAPVRVTLPSGRTFSLHLFAVDFTPDGVLGYDRFLLSLAPDLHDAEAFERGFVPAEGACVVAPAPGDAVSQESVCVYPRRLSPDGSVMSVVVEVICAPRERPAPRRPGPARQE